MLNFLEQDRDVGDLRWAAYLLATVNVNGYDQAALIEGYAEKLEALLRESSNGKEVSKGPITYQYHIVDAPAGVLARNGPGTNFPVVNTIANSSPIEIVFQVHGETINGETDHFAYHHPPRVTHAAQVSNFIHIV